METTSPRRSFTRATTAALAAAMVAATATALPVPGVAAGLAVSNSGFNSVLLVDTATGSPSTLVAPGAGGLASPDGLKLGPDGSLYVCAEMAARVLRFDGSTGAYLGDFVAAGSGGLKQCEDLVFGPGGDLFITDLANDRVLRYDGASGAFRGVFVAAGSGGLDVPSGLVFGPGGDLFVSSTGTSQILRYDGATGAFRGVFVAAGSGGLEKPLGVAFSSSLLGGDLFVSSLDTDQVMRYSGATGAFVSVFVPFRSGGLRGPYDLAFGPDGDLYVVSFSTNQVLRFDGATGAFRNAVATGGGLAFPTYLAFAPPAPCAAGSQTLCLEGGRFAVSATWQTADGGAGDAQAVALTGDTGYLWFFNAANVEAVIKVLDGCAVGGHHWVFVGGLTNVAVTLTVRDTRTGALKAYQNLQGQAFAPIQDTSAFVCP